MPFLSVIIPLESSIRNSLTRLCHGLEHVEWTDELELCIQLQQIELKNQGLVVEIRESLANIVIPPFPVSVQGIQIDKRKTGRGTLGVRVSETPELARLCKELGRNLKNLDLTIHEMPPQIILGKFQTLSPGRLANYLEAHAAFVLPLFEASSFALMEYHQTSKRSFLTPIQKFPLR